MSMPKLQPSAYGFQEMLRETVMLWCWCGSGGSTSGISVGMAVGISGTGYVDILGNGDCWL